ncbi:HAMP domain-containing histidine kinase [Clostridium estertheticum]|uniref:sensor histidine kinase n=1 Tax=Clostridium estertheticum TaxID=238834 RepID=UPI001C0E062B|nr:HAMP domain-containing sensor histidine kinase [Clostridium estertheticum]MBU3175207.1 HAMP domain-containing histidine kinase [Clostridium estertheticum]
MRPFDKKSIVIVCDLDFIVTDIIIIKNIDVSIKVGDSASKIVSHHYLSKFLDFTLTLKDEKMSFGDELSIVDANSLETVMDCGGVKYKNNYIITAFSNYLVLYGELININKEPINYLREKMEYFSVSPGNYQELSGLNNEVINMQRELYKNNKVVLDLMNKEKDMNRKLEALNSTKDRIFSIIGHDLRTPLSNIIQSMNLIAYDKLMYEEWQQENYFSKLSDSAANTMHLLENLLEWSKSQLGELYFFPRNFILLESIRNVLNLLKEVAARKRIEIVEELSYNPYVYADKRMIEVVLRNLISNAIKFTNEDGKLNIKVSMEKEFAKITIIDNGIGMPPEKLNTLFDLTKNNVTYGTKGENGTGFGLVLCKNFINQNGGSISILSQIGNGSEFIFTIPLSKTKVETISQNVYTH